ncbi:MAG: RNA pseudouridine synthase [Bacteroidota bacterium]
MLVQNIGALVLYKNNQLIAFSKPAGVPVQADRSGDKSLMDLAEIYCKRNLHLVHRIDRPVSGLLLFAKTKQTAAYLSKQFQEGRIKKQYLAVVKNAPPKEEDHLIHHLSKNSKLNKSFVSDIATKNSKEAKLSYRLMGKSDHYHLLRIELISGRHHQIRAQLAAIGCPVKGDVKYGARRSNKDRSIHLHAWKMEFQHPISGDTINIEAPLPDEVVWNAFNKSD